MVFGGDALARDNGQVVLAPYVLPGETARVETVSAKPGLVRARLVEVTERSADRIAPPCPHFTLCGGCHYQHAEYPYQVRQKVEVLGEVLRRVGKFEPPAEIGVLSGPPWEYRNRIQLHCKGGLIGFHEAGSHRIRDVEKCPVASPALNGALAALRRMARDRRWPGFLQTLELFTNESETLVNVLDSGPRHLSRTFFDWCAETIPGALSTALDYTAAGFRFRVSHRSFFQVNRFLVDPLIEAAIAGAEGGEGLDLYAGVGLFSIPLARRGMRITAVEVGASAVRDLEHNAREAGVEITAVGLQSEQYLEPAAKAPDFVLADPPRTGLGKQVIRRLGELRPGRIHIVSCDPSTLARDAAGLLAAGYRIESLTMADLFPQTSHIESILKLVR